MAFKDKDRLDFLLSQFRIDDVGDESYVPGIVINCADLEDMLSWGPADAEGNRKSLVEFADHLREVIDRAILADRASQQAIQNDPTEDTQEALLG